MGSRLHGHGSVDHLLHALVDAYDGDTYRLLVDLADLLEVSVAYVDRVTVEAHLERTLTDREWAAVAARLRPMALDERVGEAGSFRTDWIEDILARSGVSGRSAAGDRPGAAGLIRRRA